MKKDNLKIEKGRTLDRDAMKKITGGQSTNAGTNDFCCEWVVIDDVETCLYWRRPNEVCP